MRGYLGDETLTRVTVTPDGWLRTGDVGRLDERGFLTLLDRKKDVIISGGMNIYAREVVNGDHKILGIAAADLEDRATGCKMA